MATNLSWTKSIPLSSWLREKLHGSNEMRNGLEKLKKNSEDPEFAYGFPIYIGPVADTLVITKKTIAPREQVVPALKNLFGELKAYAAENRILTAPYRMAAFNYHGNGEVEIMAGIPAENKAPEMNGINYLKMPRGGRMLVGKYEGPYTSLHNLYSAMEQFRIDRALQGIAVKYEKYLTDPVTHEDSLHMKIEIYYPIF